MHNQNDTQPSNHAPGPEGETQPSIPGQTQPSTPAETQASRVTPPPSPPPAPPSGKPTRRVVILLSAVFLLALILITSLSGWAGFNIGSEKRYIQQTVSARVYLDQLYQRGLDEIANGNYYLAAQFFEYVYEQDQGYTEALDHWVEVQVILNATATPTIAPQPTPTPTQDPRPKEALYEQALVHVSNHSWTEALDTLSAIRQVDPTYRAPDVDGLIYLALRNRGVDKILNRGQLEEGLYDFALAEQFGPIDRDAEIYRTWARLYLQGNGFWLAYPDIALEYYGQVAAAAPGLTDATGMSAFYRYWASLVQYADQLLENEEWCLASEYYQQALAARADEAIRPAADQAFNRCLALTITPTSPATQTATSTSPSTPIATATFTETPVGTATTPPAETPTHTWTPTNTDIPPATTPTPENTATPTETPTSTSTHTNTPDGGTP